MIVSQQQSAALDEPLNWPTRFVMLVGGVMMTIALSVLTPVLPQIEAALAVTEDDRFLVKMLIPIVGMTMVVGAPLTGFLVDRTGMRPILATCGVVFAVAGTAGFYLANLEVLLVLRLFVGMAAAGMATMSMTLINTRLQGTDRAKWMGFHIAAAMIGALIIHPMAGLLGELGWRWPFLIYAAGLLVAASAFFGVQHPVHVVASGEDAPREEQNPLKWFPMWFLPFALVMGAITYLPTVYLPFVARDVGIASPSAISLILLADVMIGSGMALLFGASQRHISSNSAFIFSFTCTGIGMATVAMAQGPIAIVAGMLIVGLGVGWFVPNLMTALSRRVSQSQQGRAVGIVKAAHYIASPAGVLAVQPIDRAFGPSGAMMAAAFASFAVVLAFLYIAARKASGGIEPAVAES